MHDIHLAIASVPIQKWGETYDVKKALEIGTIFKELNKPFFAVDSTAGKLTAEAEPKSEEEREQEALLQKIFEVSFLLDDLTLYLDTHEKDMEGLKLYREKGKERDQLKAEFARKFYPLTRDCLVYCKEGTAFSWQDGPIPWEGACI